MFGRLLYSDEVIEPAVDDQLEVDLAYPPPGRLPSGTISYVEIAGPAELKRNGRVSVINGGVGTENITLRLRSWRGHRLHYSIRVYGQEESEL